MPSTQPHRNELTPNRSPGMAEKVGTKKSSLGIVVRALEELDSMSPEPGGKAAAAGQPLDELSTGGQTEVELLEALPLQLDQETLALAGANLPGRDGGHHKEVYTGRPGIRRSEKPQLLHPGVDTANFLRVELHDLVGVGGFEPPPSWSQTRRSILAELHPGSPSS